MVLVREEQRKWWILMAMGCGGGLIMLDETVVGVALPSLQTALGMSTVASHWVISIYLLVFAGSAAAGGKLGDVLGFRRTVILGLGTFALASAVAGAADNGTVLLIARALQGVGAAIMFPASVAMISIAFPLEQRGMALGIMAATGTVFLALGPLIGGAFTELVSWRWIFWVNIPIVLLIALAIQLSWVDPPRVATRPPLDFSGLFLLLCGLGMVVFATMQGPAWGWSRGPVPWVMAAGLAALATLVRVEARREAPLIDVSLFRIGAFSACASMLFVGQFCKISIVVFGALYLQKNLAMSPLQAGIALLASVAAFPLLSMPVGRFADQHGARRPVLVGLTLATLAMLWIAFFAPAANYPWLFPGLVLWGVGMSLCYSPTLRLLTNAVPLDAQGQVGGIAATSRLLGGVFGMAVGSTVYVSTGSFALVFLLTAATMALSLLFAWLKIRE